MPGFVASSYLRLVRRDQEGQGMLEYALIITFVALVVIAALTIFGTQIAAIYNTASASLST